MKITICTSRIRPDGLQTVFPPYGSTAIIQSLVKAGYNDTFLFDIDGLRPPYSEVIAYFQRERPDVVGISGVVSTAYKFIKQLIATLHEILPETPVIVGGNVAANSEILLRLAKADYCVIGEGEDTIVELVDYLKHKGGRGQPDDHNALRKILGITFIDENDVVVFTNYRPDIPADRLYDPAVDILARDSDINRYIIDPWFYVSFAYDRRSFEPHRKGKKLATIVSTKGCVAKCTFCHRWDQGIRFVPVDLVIERIKMFQKRYNVGFISFSDENFGSSHRWVDELLEKIAPLDILWRVGGVRCRTVTRDMLKRMQDVGCVNVQYGVESGSQQMLDVMEKNTKVQHNLDAAKWTYEVGLYTSYAMVLGMPGECPETVQETIEFLKEVTEFLPEPPYARISINRLEALPGTPVYEYGKVLGLIGRTPEEEEKYLLHISDTSGGEAGKQLNFTDYPDFIVQYWKRLMWLEVMHNWYEKNPERQLPLMTTLWKSFLSFFVSNKDRILKRVGVKDSSKGRDLIDTFVDKDFNTRRDEIEESLIGFRYHTSFYFMRHFIVLEGIVKDFFNKDIPKRWWLEKVVELLVYYVKGPKKERFSDYRSMRKIMKEIKPEPLTESEQNLIPLQLGR
ncbi:MAG: B12-binding domain-containing radical SAM protein [Candidatus Methylomirabilales bacterium]